MFKRLFLLSLLAVIGCEPSVVQLRKIEPTGTAFQTYLAREYLDYSEAEAQQYDWADSSHFAQKGLSLAKGVYVPPEKVQYWHIDKKDVPILMQAREYLLEVLTEANQESQPKLSAKAQFYYDCWMEQAEERWQDSHIDFCREKFYATLDELFALTPLEEDYMSAEPVDPEDVKQGAISQSDVVPAYAGTVRMDEMDGEGALPEGYAPSPAKPVTTAAHSIEKRLLYFAFNSSKASSRTIGVLQSIAKDLKNKSNYQISINGYTDRIGSEEANLKLSKARAMTVKSTLVEAGLDPAKITIYAFGEMQGILETKDGTAEEENRAVEVVIER